MAGEAVKESRYYINHRHFSINRNLSQEFGFFDKLFDKYRVWINIWRSFVQCCHHREDDLLKEKILFATFRYVSLDFEIIRNF